MTGKRFLQFNDGYAIDRDTVLLASREVDQLDEPVSQVAILSKGSWRFIGFDEVVASVAALQRSRVGFFLDSQVPTQGCSVPPLLALRCHGLSGRVLVVGLGRRIVEVLPTEESLGEVLRIRNIADELYVCGMAGQVYRRDDAGRWRAIDRGIRGRDQLDLGNIDGTGPKNLYAVSSFGEVVYFDGKVWRVLDLPSKVPLSGIRVVSDTEIYLCGQDGVVLRGSGPRGWEVISSGDFDHWFLSVEWFRDRLYVAHEGGLLEWFQGTWKNVRFKLKGELDCCVLQASDGVLFSFGYEHVLAFDGTWWRRIVPPRPSVQST